MHNSRKYIILGLTPQGLSLLRILGRANADVTAFCTSKRNVGYHSKYGTKKLYSNMAELKKAVAEIVESAKEKPICHITSGEILASILRDYKEIYDECQVLSGPYPIIEMLAHKDKMYHYATKFHFKIAPHATLDKEEYKQLKYPLFLKRNYEVPLFFKAVKIRTEEELASYYNRIPKEHLKDVIAQEFISIPESQKIDISCQSFWIDGKSKCIYIVNQKRRIKKGITSYCEEITDESLCSYITELIGDFMRDLHYNGFAEFEFMYNIKSKETWFIEVNTRTCGLQSSLNYKFQNLTDLILSPYSNIDLIRSTKPVFWMNILRDIRSRLENRNVKDICDIFKSKFDILDLKDLTPFFRQLF